MKEYFFVLFLGTASNMSVGPGGTLKGLKALKKESRSKLDAYQHLFYHLQTDPTYLAKLIFAMPQSSRYILLIFFSVIFQFL